MHETKKVPFGTNRVIISTMGGIFRVHTVNNT